MLEEVKHMLIIEDIWHIRAALTCNREQMNVAGRKIIIFSVFVESIKIILQFIIFFVRFDLFTSIFVSDNWFRCPKIVKLFYLIVFIIKCVECIIIIR